MKLANRAFIIALTMLTLVFSMSAQTLRSVDDPRNTAPTVGTGGPPGGPTGLFTVYDGQTLRAGEFTFSAAYSNYDRDPGDADIVEVPISFQIGLSDHVELFFNTDAYRAIKVNSPRNLSSFSNTLFRSGTTFSTPGSIVLGPGVFSNVGNRAVFIPGRTTTNPFPFIGGTIGTVNGVPLVVGSPVAGGNGAAAFPGLGSVYGSILPGVVLQTATINVGGTAPLTVPTVFSLLPSYLPDAPFINDTYGTSRFSTFTVGGKIRFTGPNNPYGIGIIPFYRFYTDRANDSEGFAQLQQGSSPGGGGFNPFSSNRGDIGLVLFGDARLRKWINVSANVGYIHNSSVKGNFPTTTGASDNNEFTILDRPSELIAGVALDFPVNKFFQPILEFRSTQYVGGRTPNAFENNPLDGIAGARFYPTRWLSLGAAYRHHFNQQDRDSFEGDTFTTSSVVAGTTITTTNTFTGVPPGFRTSSDPHGFILQIAAGRRNARTEGKKENLFADVTNLELGETRVTTPCAPGQSRREGSTCTDDMSVNVTTTALDPEGDVLTYNYTVSGGRIVGQGANVSWDLTGVQPGTYTITSGVDDGCGVCGKTQTRTITVDTCNDCIVECVCPTLTVSGPDTASVGQEVTFTANLSGGSSEDFTYNWTVTAGEIISGQGTPSIRVGSTSGLAGQTITATVDVRSTTCTSCNRLESASVAFPDVPVSTLFTEFGPAVPDEIKAQIDNFYVELNNNPTAQGYIINYGTDREIARREKQIRDAIAFRKQDPSRVTFVRGGDTGEGVKTKFYIVPAGATPPTP